MRKTRIWLALSLGLALFSCARNRDLILHYACEADFFEEALPLGNGTLGAMVYGGTTRTLDMTWKDGKVTRLKLR